MLFWLAVAGATLLFLFALFFLLGVASTALPGPVNGVTWPDTHECPLECDFPCMHARQPWLQADPVGVDRDEGKSAGLPGVAL